MPGVDASAAPSSEAMPGRWLQITTAIAARFTAGNFTATGSALYEKPLNGSSRTSCIFANDFAGTVLIASPSAAQVFSSQPSNIERDFAIIADSISAASAMYFAFFAAVVAHSPRELAAISNAFFHAGS